MANETVATDHTSTADEQFEKKENEEANGQKSVSLSDENKGEVDKAEDQKPEGDERKAELAVVEVKNSDNCPALEASAEDNLKHGKVEDSQGPTVPFSKTEGEAEGDGKKVEPTIVIEKTDGSPSSEASVADNLKEEKELIPNSQTISVSQPAPDAGKSEPEEPQPTETEEDKQPKAADIPEASAGTVEKSNNTAEACPLIESEAVKETENLKTSSHNAEKPKPVVTEVQEQSAEPEKVSQDKANEAEQPNIVAIPDPSAETNETPSDAIEKPEPIVTEVQEKPEEPEQESQEKPREEAEQSNPVAIPDLSAETNEESSDAKGEKTREPEFDVEALKETNKYEAGPKETEKAEPVATEIEGNSGEPEKQSFKNEEEKQPKTEVESAEKPGHIVEVGPPQESDIEVVKEIGNSKSEEVVPLKEDEPKLLSTEVEEKPGEQLEVAEEVRKIGKNAETEKETVIEAAESNGSSDDTFKQPISVKEEKADKEEETIKPGNSAQVSLNEEVQAAPAIGVESSPAIAEKAVEGDGEKDEIQGVSKEAVGIFKNPEEASINQEAKADLTEEREYPSATSVEEKVAAANDDTKQPGAPDVVEGFTKEAAVEIKKVRELSEAKTATTEAGGVKVESVKDDRPEVDIEREGHPKTKGDEITAAVSEPVRETLASKLEEKEEESIRTGVDNLEKIQNEYPVKTDIQIPEPPTRETEATKTTKDIPKETPAKPSQKQSNNIISKVKQSLVKAKKAITGKSPTSKTISSEAKGDIKVK